MNFIEEELLGACIKKERKAQYELFKKHYSFLFGISIRYFKNKEDADEMVNVCFLKILNNLEKYRKEIPFTLWMRRIMINTVIDEHRKNKKEKEIMQSTDFNEHYEEFEESTMNDYIKKADAEYIHTMIKELPPMSQKVFNLYAIDGFAHKEIAVMLEMSEGTSKWHLNFSRNKLKEMFAKTVNPIKQLQNER